MTSEEEILCSDVVEVSADVVEVSDVSIVGGGLVLERLEDGDIMTSEEVSFCSDIIEVSGGVSAGVRLLIGGLDGVIDAEDEGGGGDRDGCPDEKLF